MALSLATFFPHGRIGDTQSMFRPCAVVAEASDPNGLPWWASDPENPSYERAGQQRLLQPCDLLNEAAVPVVISFNPDATLKPSSQSRSPCVLFGT